MSDVTFQQALHLISLGRAHEALEKLGEEFDPEKPWEWWARALALLRLDRTEEARDAVEQGLAIDAEAPM
ncbi:MAG TPA: hypothetical protein VE010_09960, partial [Thermoanaerobaculia bacterium]|nr:hypothetical protein [Thermoanaerobaculia bacterium]